MRVLLLGGSGQLGRELQLSVPAGVELLAPSRAELDVGRGDQVAPVVAALAPDLILNCAAYTEVDRAEEEPEKALAVNRDGPRALARAAEERRCRMIQISTDFVFDGGSDRPYRPDDRPRPLSVYGRSKLAGEEPVLALSGGSGAVVRTAWLYSRFGRNFVKTMLALMRSGRPLRVVADQAGTPTWARGLAVALWKLAAKEGLGGIFHWTDSGETTWFDFAVAIQDEAIALGLLERRVAVEKISTAERPAKALRPAYSVLDCTAARKALEHSPPPWREALRSMLGDLASCPDE